MTCIAWVPVGSAGREYIRETAVGEAGPTAPLGRKIHETGSVYSLLDEGTPASIAVRFRSGGLNLAGDSDESIVEFLNARPNHTFLALDVWMPSSMALPDSSFGLGGLAAFGSIGLLGREGGVDGFSLLHMRRQFGFMTGILVSSFVAPEHEVQGAILSADTERNLVDHLEGFFLTAYDNESWVAWTKVQAVRAD